MITKTILKTRKFKVGYEVRLEEWIDVLNIPTVVKAAYTPTGDYIGDPRMAYILVVKYGIKPELRTDHSNVCTIGFCEREQAWYGWSHRAICGFGIGDNLFDEFYPGADEHTPFAKHGSKPIETLDEARQAASNFAESVS